MPYNPEIHHRRSIRLKDYDYSQMGAYFVTICTKDRECLFGEISDSKMELNDAGVIVAEVWNDLQNRFPVKLDEYVIMPNHVHGIIIVNNVGAIHELPLHMNKNSRRQMLIPKILGYYKMNAAKRINQIRNISGTPVWQLNNPLQWELDNENPQNINKRQHHG
ncbi:MAG: transposase [Nitrospirota bacterium]